MPLSTDTPYGAPYDPAADAPAICVLCAGNVDAGECVCPECPTCGVVGDPDCLLEGHFLAGELNAQTQDGGA